MMTKPDREMQGNNRQALKRAAAVKKVAAKQAAVEAPQGRL
jgi:hypothetical protein